MKVAEKVSSKHTHQLFVTNRKPQSMKMISKLSILFLIMFDTSFVSAQDLTDSQKIAATKAEFWLNTTIGYSRSGLIKVLGNTDDVIIAVDSLSIDWKEQAIRRAKSILESAEHGSSRLDFINLISSSSDVAGGFGIEDLITAVDSLDIDWNLQAAKSAKKYISENLSCEELIGRLTDNDGKQFIVTDYKYTLNQATYGAQQAGIC